jgi:hypothetical protein
LRQYWQRQSCGIGSEVDFDCEGIGGIGITMGKSAHQHLPGSFIPHLNSFPHFSHVFFGMAKPSSAQQR